MKRLFDCDFNRISIADRTHSPSHNEREARLFDGYGLYFSLSGEGSFFTEGAEYAFSGGSVILVRPLVCHGIKASAASNVEYREIVFSAGALSKGLVNLLDSTALSGVNARLFHRPALYEELASAFSRFENVTSLPENTREPYAQALLSEIIVLLSASNGEGTLGKGMCLGARIAEYVNDNLTDNLSLDTLSRVFFVSKYHLCRAFKAYSGISVHGYISKKRVLLAKQLIETGEAPSSVAYKVGFGDYSAFYRAYVRLLSKSPTGERVTLQDNNYRETEN